MINQMLGLNLGGRASGASMHSYGMAIARGVRKFWAKRSITRVAIFRRKHGYR